MSSVCGTVPKALLMSIVARSVLYAGLETFRPSCVHCFSIDKSVVVECRAMKPYCVGDKGIWAVIELRISPSRI